MKKKTKKAVKVLKKVTAKKVKKVQNKRAKKRKTTKKYKRAPLLNFKVDSKDRKAIAKKANKHVAGNVSAWTRYAAIHYVPPKGVVIR